MLTYNAIIMSPNGKESPFSISVDIGENGFEGEMVWEDDAVLMKKVRYQNDDSFYCLLLWLGVYTRTEIVVTNDHDIYTLSIRIIGQAFDYTLTKGGYKGFQHFTARLNVNNPFPRKRDNSQEFDLSMDESNLDQKRISLYEGSNMYKNLQVFFTGCSVNGSPVNVEFPRSLPQELGTYIELGFYDIGEIIQIQWTFQVWAVPFDATLTIGAFRNGRLRDRTPLQSYMLKQHQSYKGSASLTV